MQSDDKRNLMVAGYIVGAIAFAALCFIFMHKAHVLIILGICLVLQQTVLIPKMVEYWYRMKGYDIGFSKYVPVYNEMQILSPFFGWAYAIGIVLLVVAAGTVYFLPHLTQTASLDGYDLVLDITNKLIYFCMFDIVLTTFLRGLGYVEIMKEISYVNMEINGIEEKGGSILNVFFYALAFVPLVRSIALVMYDTNLYHIVVLAGYDEEYDVEQVDYEEY